MGTRLAFRLGIKIELEETTTKIVRSAVPIRVYLFRFASHSGSKNVTDERRSKNRRQGWAWVSRDLKEVTHRSWVEH